MAIVPPPMHFPARDYVNTSEFLIQNSPLSRAYLGIGKVTFSQLT